MRGQRFPHARVVELIIAGLAAVSLIIAIGPYRPLSHNDGTGGVSAEAAVTPAPMPPPYRPQGSTISVPHADLQDLTLVATTDAQMMSQQDAEQIIAGHGIVWALGGVYQEHAVTIRAYYGLATFGRPEPNSNKWVGGPTNVQLTDGTVLPHIEDRPMWIIDYGNVVTTMTVGGVSVTFDHAVYAVDAETHSLFQAWAYNSQQ